MMTINIVDLLLIGLCQSHWTLTTRSLVEQGGMELWVTVGSTTPSKRNEILIIRKSTWLRHKALYFHVGQIETS